MRTVPFVIVAADVPAKYHALLEDGKLQPVRLMFVVRDGHSDLGSNRIEMDVRDLTPEEIVAVVNRALAEGRLQFGFRPGPGPGRGQGPALVLPQGRVL